MRRRALLAALPTALLAGCNQPAGTTTASTTGTPTPTPNRTPTSTVPASADVFEFDVRVVRGTPTADHPPSIRIYVMNRAESAHTLTIPNYAFPFAAPEGAGDDAALILDEGIPTSREGGCWTGVWKVLPMISGHRFTPGDTVSREYAVLNDRDNETCWPPGTYEFTQTYYLDPESPNTTEGGTAFDWGFAIRIHDDTTTISIAESTPSRGPESEH